MANISLKTMRGLHAAGREVHLDHEAIHIMAAENYGVDSLTRLAERDARDMLQKLRRMAPGSRHKEKIL